MLRSSITLACIALVVAPGVQPACGQIKVADDTGLVRLGDVTQTRYRVGASVTAKRGAVRNVLATVAVPLTCPEQEVQLVDEDISSFVAHNFRLLQGGGARQLLINVAQLPNKAEAHAILTFEVRTRTILPPDDTSELTIPAKPPKELKRYLGKSPYIETNHSKIRRLANEIFNNLKSPGEPASAGGDATARAVSDWQRVEAIYDHVQNNIKYVEGPDKSALATLKAGEGDCQNISALFIALCRTKKIPARIVWVHQHNYPEFCLTDAEGTPHWFPCESSGTRAFGEMPLARVILQKGDNFKVPERKQALRYASDYMIGVPAGSNSGPPSHKFIREML